MNFWFDLIYFVLVGDVRIIIIIIMYISIQSTHDMLSLKTDLYQ